MLNPQYIESYLKNKYFLQLLFSQWKNVKNHQIPSLQTTITDPEGAVDLVFAGCSFTSGVGVHPNDRWGLKLAKKLGVSNYTSVSSVGWCMDEIVTNTINYIEIQPTPPKYVAMLATEISRMAVPIITDAAVVGRSLPEQQEHMTIRSIQVAYKTDESIPTYSRKPHIWEEILPTEIAMYQSLSAITRLIMYCNLKNINFVWGTWDRFSKKLYDGIISSVELSELIDMNNYVDIPTYDRNEDNLPDSCHQEDRLANPKFFDKGSDNSHHAGTHHHIHWAESFYGKLIEIERLK